MKNIFLYFFKFPIYFYKYCISPILPHSCRFTPTCSNYFLQSLENFGCFKGSVLGIKRICKCVPWNKNCGYDPVPINIKGEQKWLL